MELIKIILAIFCILGITFCMAESTSPNNPRFFFKLVLIEVVSVLIIMGCSYYVKYFL